MIDVMSAVELTLKNGGGTFTAVQQGKVLPVVIKENAKWAWVSATTPGQGFENVEVHISPESSPEARKADIAQAIWEFVRLSHDRTLRFGTWIDDDVLYIDHVVVGSREMTEVIARKKNEKAIFNLVTKETVRLDG